jgi:hypothetical protein
MMLAMSHYKLKFPILLHKKYPGKRTIAVWGSGRIMYENVDDDDDEDDDDDDWMIGWLDDWMIG